MATFSAVFSPTGPGQDLSSTVTASASSAEIVLGTDRIFAINATDDVNIAFGVSGMAAAAATNFRIPGGTVATYDTGQFDRIRLYNATSATITYYIQLLTKA